MAAAVGTYVFLEGYCGRIEKIEGPVLFFRIDDVSAKGRVEAAFEHFGPLYERGEDVPATSIWADGASVRITALRYDPERKLLRLKTERNKK